MSGEVAEAELPFIAAVNARPGDDTPRLVYADWLDENGEESRAEFVRVQVELARMDDVGEGIIDPHEGHTCCEDPCPVCVSVERYDALRRREQALFDEHWARWGHQAFDSLAPDVGISTDGDENRIHVHLYGRKPRQDETGDFYCTFRRGFVHSLTLPWAAWAGGACPNCREAGKFLDGRRGSPTYGQTIECRLCSGSGRTHGVAESLYWRIQTCPGCHGEGWTSVPDDKAAAYDEQIGRHPMIPRAKTSPCPRCSGSGRVVPTVGCERCHGLKGIENVTYDPEQAWGVNLDKAPYALPCDVCNATGRVPRPCPPDAQPVERVALTTWPETQHFTEVRNGGLPVRFRGRTAETLVTDAEIQQSTWEQMRPAVVTRLLGLEWPGISFALPAADPREAVDLSYSDLR